MRPAIISAFLVAIACILSPGTLSAEVKRVIILKLDGVPERVIERDLARIDPDTHKSTLPWFDHVFVERGTRLENFYVRSISLSTPSWSIIDTGQHLQIHGNAEFDRYTYHVYDYMNFFPFYLGYARSRRVDMPGVEVLDSLGIPLLIDRFPYPDTYEGFQLYQRGVKWKTLEHALRQRFAGPVRELLDEWTMGFEVGSTVEDQTERELIAKLSNPKYQYLDYFTGDYDHVAHATSDPAAQRLALQRIDGVVGRIWTAIQASPLAAQTVLVVVSDHGMNTEAGVYSQGYNLVHFFGSVSGGGHHVVTDRHPLDEFKLKGLDPFVSEVVTPSDHSFYLKGQADDYPTVLLDPDGNERASVYLRNSDFNALQILLQEINRSGVSPAIRHAAIGGFFKIIDRNRDQWSSEATQLTNELAALNRAIEQRRVEVAKQPKKWTQAQQDAGLDKAARRLSVELDSWQRQEREYRAYLHSLNALLDLEPAEFDRRHLAVSDLIPKRAMGDANSIYDLQNYIVGPAAGGLALSPDGTLDFEHSFRRLDYFPLLHSLSVMNNVQAAVSSHPVDFTAMRVPKSDFDFPSDETPDHDPVWLYGDEDHQVLILARKGELRYLPIRHLHQDAAGNIRFEAAPIGPGFPLHYFEDANLAVAPADREQWLNAWHSELDWLHAIHKTEYSVGAIALNEQFLEPLALSPTATSDAALLARFNQRRRMLAQPDFQIFANDHWNFNVRNFNPGGNHGSMLRVSTHAILMFAGGADTGVPQHLVVQEPYDTLSVVPTILDLMGKHADASELPGRPIREILPDSKVATSK